MGLLINIDNGGTLTDLWAMDGESAYHTKTITTPYDLSKCFFEGLRKLAGMIYGREDLATILQHTDHIRYSTTQGTNALVMKKGPRLGLVVDNAFDIAALTASPCSREMFDVMVGERVETLDTSLEDDIYHQNMVEVMNRLSSRGASRVVVAFTGDHRGAEARLRRAVLSMFPRHLLGAVPTLYAGSISADRDPARRCWTALNNAFLHPEMERFLYNAENRLREHRVKNPLLIYRNDGFSGRVAKTIAVKTYSSGPRAGMDSARAYAEHYGFERLLTMDVGGTTTDIGLVENGGVAVRSRGEIEGIECSLPLADIVSIGIGGGSVFRVENGCIKVGPDSVGGAPGPACFGMGGTEATITDALLVMGLLDPKTYFGGAMKLDRERAVTAIRENIADKLKLPVEAAVHEMLRQWSSDIADGIARYTDITDETVLTAFGGGGPMGAPGVAETAGIRTVLIPRLSAVFSAHGIGFSDIAHSAQAALPANDGETLRRETAALRERVQRDMHSEGFEPGDYSVSAWLVIAGREHTVDPENPELPAGTAADDEASLIVRAVKTLPRASLPKGGMPAEAQPKTKGMRSITSREGKAVEYPVIDVEQQSPGATGRGPAVIEDRFWTCKVDSHWQYRFTDNGDILLTYSDTGKTP